MHTLLSGLFDELHELRPIPPQDPHNLFLPLLIRGLTHLPGLLLLGIQPLHPPAFTSPDPLDSSPHQLRTQPYVVAITLDQHPVFRDRPDEAWSRARAAGDEKGGGGVDI